MSITENDIEKARKDWKAAEQARRQCQKLHGLDAPVACLECIAAAIAAERERLQAELTHNRQATKEAAEYANKLDDTRLKWGEEIARADRYKAALERIANHDGDRWQWVDGKPEPKPTMWDIAIKALGDS